MGLQRLIHAIYPAQCVACGNATADDHGLCGECWRDTTFVHGLTCDTCGFPLPGEADPDQSVFCDDCMAIERPWMQGRSALLYAGVGRKLILGLKHGDRTDLVPAMARWMLPAASPLLHRNTLLVPVPLHWSRMLKRRYNQAALLAHGLAKLTGAAICPDALVRHKKTRPLDGHNREERFAALNGAIKSHPNRGQLLSTSRVLLIDDVMTSGATLTAATQACLAAGSQRVDVLTLARVGKEA